VSSFFGSALGERFIDSPVSVESFTTRDRRNCDDDLL
jgi:hypothetical protein